MRFFDVENSLDYYSFGMLMPERFGGGNYRYGYQGSEKDNEVKGEGNSYTTHFRQLDPRLGRWLTIDPKATAWESPYVSMGNNPIWYNDVLGDTIRIINSKNIVLLQINIDEPNKVLKTFSQEKFAKFQNSANEKAKNGTLTDYIIPLLKEAEFIEVKKKGELASAYEGTSKIFAINGYKDGYAGKQKDLTFIQRGHPEEAENRQAYNNSYRRGKYDKDVENTIKAVENQEAPLTLGNNYILIKKTTDYYIEYKKNENGKWVKFESKIGKPQNKKTPEGSIPFKK